MLRFLAEQGASWTGTYDRLAPTISYKAKKLFGSGNMGQNNWGAVPLWDGMDTRPCKILDTRL